MRLSQNIYLLLILFFLGCNEEKIKTTEFSVQPGVINEEINLKLFCKTDGVKIYYTLNGKEPRTYSKEYNNEEIKCKFDTITQVKAFATKKGMGDSDKIEGIFEIKRKVEKPYFNIIPGIFDEEKRIIIDCEKWGIKIYYTLDGSEPSENSNEYQLPIFIGNGESFLIKAVAIKEFFTNSDILEGDFKVRKKLKPVNFSVLEGKYKSEKYIYLNSLDDSEIYYTLDDSEPNRNSKKYEREIFLPYGTEVNIKAIAIKKECVNSDISEAYYQISGLTKTPTINLDNKKITIMSKDLDAKIYYTLDGSEPRENSQRYYSPFTFNLNEDLNVKAIAIKENYLVSKTTKFFFKAETSFEKLIGGDDNDVGKKIIYTKDNGFLIVGNSETDQFNSLINNGYNDIYVVKLDKEGKIDWEKLIGGSGDDYAYDVKETIDGYIIVGYSDSKEIKDIKNNGKYDSYIIKLDKNGKIEWEKLIGGKENEYIYSLTEAKEGYILAGYVEEKGNTDIYLLKIDFFGNVISEKKMNYGVFDEAYVIKKNKNGYILIGSTYTNNSMDVLALNLDINLNVVWKKTFGGYKDDYAYDVEVDGDSFVITGESNSYINGIKNNGNTDCYVLKIDLKGTIIWQKMIGRSKNDSSNSIEIINEKYYVIVGYTENKDNTDVYLIELDKKGDLISEKQFGGNKNDYAYSFVKTEKGYALLGESNSDNLSSNLKGYSDLYILKLNENKELIKQGGEVH